MGEGKGNNNNNKKTLKAIIHENDFQKKKTLNPHPKGGRIVNQYYLTWLVFIMNDDVN